MGFGELTEWVIGKIKLTNYKRNEKFGSNPFGKRLIPSFHYSMCEARVPNLTKW